MPMFALRWFEVRGSERERKGASSVARSEMLLPTASNQ